MQLISRQATHQVRRIDSKAAGNLQKVVEAEIALSALHLAEEGPVNAADVSESFLAETKFGSLGANART